LLVEDEQTLLSNWLACQKRLGALRSRQIAEAEMTDQSRRLLAALRSGIATGEIDDITAPAWDQTRTVLEEVSRSRAALGVTPTETALFVLSLKEPIFTLLRQKVGKNADRLAHETWMATLMLDRFGLYTVEAFQKSREAIIARQQDELLETIFRVMRRTSSSASCCSSSSTKLTLGSYSKRLSVKSDSASTASRITNLCFELRESLMSRSIRAPISCLPEVRDHLVASMRCTFSL